MRTRTLYGLLLPTQALYGLLLSVSCLTGCGADDSIAAAEDSGQGGRTDGAAPERADGSNGGDPSQSNASDAAVEQVSHDAAAEAGQGTDGNQEQVDSGGHSDAGTPSADSGGKADAQPSPRDAEAVESGNSGSPKAVTTTYPIVCPAPGFAASTTSAPVVVDGKHDVVLRSLKIQNPDGPCISITGSMNVRVVDSEIGPCKGAGIQVSQSSGVSVVNSYIHDTKGNGVDGNGSNQLSLTDSCLARIKTGLYVNGGQGIHMENNSILNVQGPIPRGQLVQLNGASGENNVIRCNRGENHLGESTPEDAINLFNSHGTEKSPILLYGNRILGGGPSTAGGGILLGDGGGSWQRAENNISVDPGQYGNAVCSGSHMSLVGNRIYGKQQPFTNVGIYVWNIYSGQTCDSIDVSTNQVNYTKKDGSKSNFWNGNNCTNVSVGKDNQFGASLSPSMINEVPPGCN